MFFPQGLESFKDSCKCRHYLTLYTVYNIGKHDPFHLRKDDTRNGDPLDSEVQKVPHGSGAVTVIPLRSDLSSREPLGPGLT